MYIFDEPSVGLHPRDVHRLNELLQKLRDKGNTVIVVEHDPDVIKIADHVVDVGPHAGTAGGRSRLRRQLRATSLRADTLTATAPAAGAADQARRAAAERTAAHQERARQQPAERQRRHPDRCADGDHRRRRLRQELAHQRSVPAPASRRGRDRSVGRGHVDALQSGDLHRRDGRRAQGVRGGQQGRRRRCSASTRRARARTATAPASSTPTSRSWTA